MFSNIAALLFLFPVSLLGIQIQEPNIVARNFVVNSQSAPDYTNQELWRPVSEEKQAFFRVDQRILNNRTDKDEKSWIIHETQTMAVIFRVKEYLHKNIPLQVDVYSLWNGSDYIDVALSITSRDPDRSKVASRTGINVQGQWYMNMHLFNSNNPDSDIKAIAIGYYQDDKTTPVTIKFSFTSFNGVKELIAELPHKQ